MNNPNEIKKLNKNIKNAGKITIKVFFVIGLISLLIFYPQFFFFATFGIIGFKKLYSKHSQKEEKYFKAYQNKIKKGN